jgi:hypothetical protein
MDVWPGEQEDRQAHPARRWPLSYVLLALDLYIVVRPMQMTDEFLVSLAEIDPEIGKRRGITLVEIAVQGRVGSGEETEVQSKTVKFSD